MADAIIAASARSPIGRAGKGSLKDLRPDDLTSMVVRALLEKVPALAVEDIDDFMFGCGLPGGEQGFNLARSVAAQLGYDQLPATTLTRYCASSLHTTRMALHAIRAGEGDVFISAGVRDLNIDIDRLNLHGGAIAVGHPFGMTGARLTGTLINGLAFEDKHVGLVTMCVAGGRGMAMILERLT